MMKIDEFIEKVNRNDRMEAEEIDGVITIYNDSDHEVIDIPNGATNLLEIDFIESYSRYNFGKPSREYLSALIEEFLHTPIKERFPEKKYRLRWLNDMDGDPNYADYSHGTWFWETHKVNAKTYTEKELQQLKINNPRLAPAIDAMKEPMEEYANEN
ncbi:hypothetical protein CP356_09690 [Lactobacillus sp. UMNPBX5]|nr:hypothetical protein CP356_09690 [Lactobacillus sp. UMNPBX5]